MTGTFSRPAGRPQQGAALIVVLILLLVMTLLGLTILRSTLMEERMSANLRDRSLSFQAAEAALREGEELAQANLPAAFPNSGCNAGLCSTPNPNNTERWLDNSFNGWRNAATSVGAITATPQFIVEYMGDGPRWLACERLLPQHQQCMAPRYRITVRSTAADRANVFLQSHYIRQ